MLVIADSMVLIHLAKITLLKLSCDFFDQIIISSLVYKEIVVDGKQKGYADAHMIGQLINDQEIKVESVRDRSLIKKANEFNIQGGEAEVVALYWQKKAGLIASDDDNIRRKKHLLELKLIGTPAIILTLFKNNIINKEKLIQSINELRRIGWFSNAILDKILMEVKKTK